MFFRWWRALPLLMLLGTRVFALPSFITFPSDIDWMTRKSEHFQIIYRAGNDALAAKTLGYAEKAHRLLSPIFPPGPERTWIVFADFHDSTNGYALTFPYPHMVIFASPPDAISQLNALDNWLESIVLHEYVHILHIYPAGGLWKPMRSIFGSWVVPNGLMPTHFHEGMATFLETELTAGGRGRGSLFRMHRRMAVEANRWNVESLPLDSFEASASRWPHGLSPYFYGYHLIEELWRRRQAKGIYQLTDSYSSNWPYYLDRPLEEVFGTSYDVVWDDVFRRTGEETKKEIEAIKAQPLSPLTKFTTTKFNKWDVTLSPDGKRVAFRKGDPKGGAGLAVLDASTGKRIEEVDVDDSATEGLCWGRVGNRELMVVIKTSQANSYSINHLAVYDFTHRKFLSLDLADKKKDLGHVHRLGCSADLTRVYTYHEVALKGVVRELKLDFARDKPSVRVAREWDLPEGSWVTSFLALDSEGVFALRSGLSSSLYRWVAAKTPQRVLDVGAHVYNLRLGRKPGEVLAIANIDGRDEIWALEPQGSQGTKVVSLLGGTLSFDRKGEDFYLSSYEIGGYDIVKARSIASKPRRLSAKPATNSRQLASGSELGKISAPDTYSPWPTILPKTWVPSMFLVPDGAQIGVWIPGFDLSQKHWYNIFGGYDTRGIAFATGDYAYRFGSGMNIGVNAYSVPSYLIRDRTIQQKWGGSVGLSGDFLPTPPAVSIRAVYKKSEASSLSAANRAIGPEISLSYQTGFKRRPLDVAPIRGTAISLSHAQFFEALGSDDNHYSTVAALEQHLHAPWADGHAWSLSLKGGLTEGTALFNSYFEGGGEFIFSQGRGSFLNRGFVPGTFIARRIVNLNVEYTFPISRVDRGRGLLPFYLKNLYGALVTDVTTIGSGYAANEVRQKDEIFGAYYTSSGIELRTEWTFFFYLGAQLRLGVYHGFGPVGEQLYGTLGAEIAL